MVIIAMLASQSVIMLNILPGSSKKTLHLLAGSTTSDPAFASAVCSRCTPLEPEGARPGELGDCSSQAAEQNFPSLLPCSNMASSLKDDVQTTSGSKKKRAFLDEGMIQVPKRSSIWIRWRFPNLGATPSHHPSHKTIEMYWKPLVLGYLPF